jgi:DNA-binding XRE family transcriptional regulator
MESVPQIIRETRNKQNLTQEEFGKVFGVSKQSVSFWEKGLWKPKMKTLLRLSKTTGWVKDFADRCISLMLD